MKKRLLAFLIFGILAMTLCACAPSQPGPSTDGQAVQNPAPFVYFFNPDQPPILEETATTLTATVHNDSNTVIRTGTEFTVRSGTQTTVGTGVVESVQVEMHGTETVTFRLSDLPLQENNAYTLVLPCLWTDADGTQKSFPIEYYFFKAAQSKLPPPQNNDILTTPIANLTQSEQASLAQYLFELYIPCSYGLFSDPSAISSPSVWSSIVALNRKINNSTATSCTLQDALTLVEIYYPDAAFDPEKVMVYDAETETFSIFPTSVTQEYVFLSYEVNNGLITIHYEDKPDVNDPDSEALQYATTLKNSTTEGYFAFVSSVRTGAVG